MKMLLNLWSKINELNEKKNNELIWILEHDEIYTAGTVIKRMK